MNFVHRDFQTGKSWAGLFSGLIWLGAFFILLLVCQALALFVFMQPADPATEIAGPDAAAEIQFDGDALALAFALTLPATVAMLAFVVAKRRQRRFAEFLGFRPVSSRLIVFWLLTAGVLMIASYVFGALLERPSPPEWFVASYLTADYALLFVLSIALFGPISEELVVRGYVLRVWAESGLGPLAAVLLSSLLWAAIHAQYDLYDLSWIFVLGVLLGLARLTTGSILPPLLIHVCWNSVALIEVVTTTGK